MISLRNLKLYSQSLSTFKLNFKQLVPTGLVAKKLSFDQNQNDEHKTPFARMG